MFRNIVLVLICVSFPGCVSPYKTQKYSELTINSKNKNRKISGRYPDYGDGRPDGCIVMPEMALSLELNNRLVVGNIRDVASGLRLSNVSVSISTNDEAKFIALTDSLGAFELKIPGKISEIKLECLGYRSLLAKF